MNREPWPIRSDSAAFSSKPPEQDESIEPRRNPRFYQLFLFVLFVVLWTCTSRIVDRFTHNFGWALLTGAVVALVAVVALTMCRAAAGGQRK